MREKIKNNFFFLSRNKKSLVKKFCFTKNKDFCFKTFKQKKQKNTKKKCIFKIKKKVFLH